MSVTDDITFNYHHGDEFSVAAHESLRPSKAVLRARVARFVRERGEHGATCDEIEVALGMAHQTASARLTELHREGVVIADGRRPTRSGRSARVHRVAP